MSMYATCHECGLGVNRPPCEIKNRKHIFCSQYCYAKEKSRRWQQSKNPRFVGGEITKKCFICNKKFSHKRYGQKRNDTILCCSKKCSDIKAGETRSGKNHWAWKGGFGRITKPIRSRKKYKEWISFVLKRDNYTCQKCFSKNDIHAHHIKQLAELVIEYKNIFGELKPNDDFFYDINNGLSLCKTCHKMEHKRN